MHSRMHHSFGRLAQTANALFASGTRVLPPVPVYRYNYPPFERDARVPPLFPASNLSRMRSSRLDLMSPTLIKTSPVLCTAGGPFPIRGRE